MKVNKLFSLFLVFVIFSTSIKGNTITFTVISKEAKIPLQANVVLNYNNSDNYFFQCDKSGKVQINFPDTAKNVLIEIQYENYIPIIYSLVPQNKLQNLGIIKLERVPKELDEVVVYGSSDITRAGKKVVFPTKLEISRNYNTSQLLADLQSRTSELEVNPVMESILINGVTPVFQINGRIQPINRLMHLSPERVQKIEMITYNDIRYGAPVFNIILKPATSGGDISLRTQVAATTPKTYSTANGSINYKKSEFNFNYSQTFRNSDEQYENSEESYIAPDFYIKRKHVGIPSSTINQNNSIRLDYILVPNSNIIFALTGNLKIHHNRYKLGTLYEQEINGQKENPVETWIQRHYARYPFSFGAFFKYKKGKQTFELSSSLANSSDNSKRNFFNSNEFLSTRSTYSSSMSSGTDVVYALQLPSNLDFKFGGSYYYSYSKSNFIQNENNSYDSKMQRHNISLYHQSGWYHKGFSVVGSAGTSFYSTYNGNYTESQWSCRGNISVNQKITKAFSGSYSISVIPSIPSFSNLSSVKQELNDLAVQIGNPKLKSGLNQTHQLRLNYRLKKLFISPYAFFCHHNKAIIEQWYYSHDDNNFIKTFNNAKYYSNLKYGFRLSVSNLFNKINLSSDFSITQFNINDKNETISKCHANWILNANAYFGPLTISARVDPIKGIQYGNNSYTYYRAFNYLSVNYRYKDLLFGIEWQNPMTKRAFFDQIYGLSKVHPTIETYEIKNFNNMILFTLQYQLKFGNRYKKPSVKFSDVRTENNIEIEY